MHELGDADIAPLGTLKYPTLGSDESRCEVLVGLELEGDCLDGRNEWDEFLLSVKLDGLIHAP